MTPPITKYTKSQDINIAYQVFGSGSIDLVYIPGWVSNIDWMWSCPDLVEFLLELGKTFRVILFDKRGTGLSDRVVELSTLEERMEDITAVMDAVGSKKAVLFGHSEGGSVSALFSATYPNRVISLITFGIFAQRKQSENYPWAPSDEERQKLYHMIENNWCSGKMDLEILAPSKAKDIEFMTWLISYFRYGASPRAALKLTKMNTEVNIIAILKYIKVPTLIMQRTHDVDVKIAEGKFIAEHIKNAKFVEFTGSDHLFWLGNKEEVLLEMKNFISKNQSDFKPKKSLITLVFGQFLSSIQKNTTDKFLHEIVRNYGGSIVCSGEESFIVAFEVSGKAVKGAVALQENLKSSNIQSRIGLCMKEALRKEEVSLCKEDKDYLKLILSKVGINQVLVSQGIKYLLSGIAFEFIKETSIFNTNTQDICTFYKVERISQKPNLKKEKLSLHKLNSDSFVGDIFKIIHQHIEDDSFGIEKLSKSMGVSQRQLQRKIKELTKKSPTQLITSIRLKKAKETLISNDYTIAEVAFKFGFSTPSYFTRCFKKEFGVNPTTFQNKKNSEMVNLQFLMS
ncbi:alpha/beta fold hydrolase [Tenacibaculum jejuense]|uniref:Putative hydrolase n=1 Tax=Tenacibaculum jejuense TaxID=584609 RepID=A0A238UD42_9FLAO|nr:alpha/beta fold hydrolase [Tenacibaculum jejuense]SNR16936.1 putative hydrolase [Tenacibaculum jejuense]